MSRIDRGRRAFAALLVAVAAGAAAPVHAAEKLRFITGPFRGTEAETRRLWGPLFDYLAAQLGVEGELTIAGDWPAVGRAMVEGRQDVAWMGGAWRYVLARSEGAGPAIATVAFNGSPTYRAIVVQRPGLDVKDFPRDARGLSLSFTHDASSTGWLVPYAWLVGRGIDPRTYFRYSATAEHPQNETLVAQGRVDLATDHDNNRNAMIARGAVRPEDVRIVWTSEPVPQDPIAVRDGLDPALVRRLQDVLAGIDAEGARRIPMPPGYTGFVTASDASYAAMREAGIATGRIRRSP